MNTPQTMPAVNKAVSVIQYIADQSDPVTVKELTYSLEIPPASCYRLVRTLLDHNWLREDPNGGLLIAFGLAHVARSYSELETQLRQLTPALRKLANGLELSAKITLREGHYAVTALRAEPTQPNAITSPIGYRFHLGIGSAAAVLLAQLEDHKITGILQSAPKETWQHQTPNDVWQRIRDYRVAGICYDLGQQHPAIFAASTSLTLGNSQVVALTVVGWPDDFGDKRRASITQHLTKAAKAMQAQMSED